MKCQEMKSSLASPPSFQGKPCSEDGDPVPNRTAFFIYISSFISMRTGTASVHCIINFIYSIFWYLAGGQEMLVRLNELLCPGFWFSYLQK